MGITPKSIEKSVRDIIEATKAEEGDEETCKEEVLWN